MGVKVSTMLEDGADGDVSLDPCPPGGSEWIISVGNYVDNSFTALGSSDPREVRLEL